MKRGTLLAEKPVVTAPVEAKAPVEVPRPPTSPAKRAKSREGKRNVTAFIDPAPFRQLKRIGADEDLGMQELLIEGINLVFEKRGLPRIA